MFQSLVDLNEKFWSSNAPGLILCGIIAVIVYYAYVKKVSAARTVIRTVVSEYIAKQQANGMTVEKAVDYYIELAIKHVKAKPDKTDPLVLAFLESSLTRNKLISIINHVLDEEIKKNE